MCKTCQISWLLPLTSLACLAVLVAAPLSAAGQTAQNPSPMVEHTRSHVRLKDEKPPGRREPLEIGTFYVLKQPELRRSSVLQWGPMGTQQLSEASKGRFLLLGFAGNSTPDHVDQLHALPDFLKILRSE